MATKEVVLYDIPSRSPCRAWSLNTWRVRLILNYKKIPYRTEWVEYPDIKSTLAPHFPNADIQLYTVPTIALPDGEGEKYIMNSKDIAEALEAAYPDPPLLLDSAVSKGMIELQGKIWDTIEPIILTHVHKRLLNEVNYEYWRETREVWLNPDMDTRNPKEAGREWKTLDDVEAELHADGGALMRKAWERAGPFLDEIASLLKDNASGPFLVGKDVSFADFKWIGFLLFVQRIGDDQWNMMRAGASDFGPHEELLTAAKNWIVRDDC